MKHARGGLYPADDSNASYVDSGAAERRTCPACNCGWTLRDGEKTWYVNRGLTPPKKCAECRAKKRRDRDVVVERRVCRTCGTDFDLTKNESDFFLNTMGFTSLPHRCRDCRRSLREQKQQAAAEEGI